MPMKIAACLAALILLVGCDQLFSPKKKAPMMTSETLSNAPARSVSREVNGNQLVVLDIPVVSLGALTDIQHCFVWRDREFKTASISCPGSKDFEIAPESN